MAFAHGQYAGGSLARCACVRRRMPRTASGGWSRRAARRGRRPDPNRSSSLECWCCFSGRVAGRIRCRHWGCAHSGPM